jgi:hypothetical protein
MKMGREQAFSNYRCADLGSWDFGGGGAKHFHDVCEQRRKD